MNLIKENLWDEIPDWSRLAVLPSNCYYLPYFQRLLGRYQYITMHKTLILCGCTNCSSKWFAIFLLFKNAELNITLYLGSRSGKRSIFSNIIILLKSEPAYQIMKYQWLGKFYSNCCASNPGIKHDTTCVVFDARVGPNTVMEIFQCRYYAVAA